MTCPCQHALPVPGAFPKAAGRLSIDRAALRRELGGDAGVREAMTAKATGRPSANASVLWGYFTKAVYKSGDLPWLATREALQNGVDALRAAIRARKLKAEDGFFGVRWNEEERSLSFEDNGIGMDAETVLTKFLSIGESGKRDAADSGEAAGGFGVAKAVILGVSRGFRWRMHTRDNLVVAEGADAEVRIFDAEPRAGTLLTVYDVDPDFIRYWDRARGVYVGIEDRLRELLAANDLPGIRLYFGDEEVKPMFSRRGGSRVSVEGSWGNGTTAAVKAYRRAPGDRGGAYYLRLGGLFQFKVPAQRNGLKADVVVDLTTTVRPGQRGYPMNAARDGLQDQAQWTFSDLVDEVERENESVGRSEEDEFLGDEDDDGGEELADQMAEAFADDAVRRAIAAAAGGIADFYGEQAKYAGVEEPVASLAPRGTKAVQDGDAPERAWVLPAGMTAAAEPTPVEADAEAPSNVQAAKVLRAVLTEADDAGRAAGGVRTVIVTEQVDQALRRAEVGQELDGWQRQAVEGAIERAAEAALAPGGGGLIQAVAVSKATGALDAITPSWFKAMDRAEGRKVRNPFGKFAGMRISKKTYDRQRAYRFRKGYAKWVPYLLAWDGTLRLIASEARIRRTFRPGFVLDDNVVGEAVERPGGKRFLFIHPDRFAQVVKAHKERPLAVAAFVHGVAVHELTHLDGKMGDGHDEEFIARREDLGAATAHLLPAIAVLVGKLLGVAEPERDDAKRLVRVERELERARATVKETKAELAKMQRAAAAAGGPIITAGTRIAWSDLRGWLDGWREIAGRPTSSTRYAQLAAHLGALTETHVETANLAELDGLEGVLVHGHNVLPPKGKREGHHTTKLRDAIDRRRTRLLRGGDRAERLLEAAVGALRARPPYGVEPEYVAGFVARNRGALLGIVRGAFGDA
jgi:hypothetical protein